MKILTKHGNVTVVSIGDAQVLFSYFTPVALYTGGQNFRTEKYWSRITTGHINRWLAGAKAETRPQAFFDSFGD